MKLFLKKLGNISVEEIEISTDGGQTWVENLTDEIFTNGYVLDEATDFSQVQVRLRNKKVINNIDVISKLGNIGDKYSTEFDESCRIKGDFRIPDDVIKLSADVLKGCSELTSVYIPYNVETIENGAFDDCSNLTIIYYERDSSYYNWDEIFTGGKPEHVDLRQAVGSK